MASSRLPAALNVFPTLRMWPIIRPRRQVDAPAGGASNRAKFPSRSVQTSLLHLYHDLGVLVFAGASVKQTERIGDILRQVVAWGGIGGVAARSAAVDVAHHRDAALPMEDLHDNMDESIPGQLRAHALLRLASKRLHSLLQAQIEAVRPELKGTYCQEMQVVIPGTPPAGGAILPTVDGPRTLPIESYASVGVDRVSGRIVGEARFFAAGTGTYVGAVRIDYIVSRWDKETSSRKPFWGHGELSMRRAPDREVQRVRLAEVMERVLEPLWRLEKEVWAERADKLEKDEAKTS